MTRKWIQKSGMKWITALAILAAPIICLADGSGTVSPTVSWVQPMTNSSFSLGMPVTLQANPSEQGGTIAEVVYVNGSTVLGISKSAPWQFTWTPTAQGTYTIGAIAVDTMNHSKSASITIMIVPVGGGASYSLSVVNGTGSGTYKTGSIVNVSATVPAGEVFQSWTGPGVPASAPASFSYTMPPSNAVITANFVVPPTPVIQTVNPQQVPLGVFTMTINGSGFTASSTVSLGGSPLNVTAFTANSLSIAGFYGSSGTFPLTVANGPVQSAPTSVQVGVQNAVVSPSAARRFLEQAAFGPTPNDAAHVQSIGFNAWLNEQFSMGAISSYSAVTASQGGMPAAFLANAVTNSDQLRQRVAFALSQIFVTSLMKLNSNAFMIPYQQMLLNDAFTNYRQILGDVTLSAAMGDYLDMANNAASNSAEGTAPNENYAREVMQLFSIGTKMLNPDGTVQNDSNGFPLPSYSQLNVTEMARVLTGWTCAPAPGMSSPLWGSYISSNYVDPTKPMVFVPGMHDYGPKSLVNGYQAQANLAPDVDLKLALDNLANHPNTAPFFSTLLIQHLVKSNPSPAYVERVASAFTASKGDMPTVLTAILLDPEARANDVGGNDQALDGHYQEPALYLAGYIRALGGTTTAANYYGNVLATLGQDIFNAPSVFNFYSPGYVIPESGGILGPEFQLDNANAAVLRENLVASFFNQYSNPVQSYGPTMVDLSPFVPLASTPATLLNALDLTLTHGTMPAPMKQTILTALSADNISQLDCVETGVYLILTSGYYNVWH